MKQIKILALLLTITFSTIGFCDKAYLDKFQAYLNFVDNLSSTPPGEEFLKFINHDSYLNNKLREKYLYKLASEKKWPLYSKYYKKSKDITLQCYAAFADYNYGNKIKGSNLAKNLWLTGGSQSSGCMEIFSILLKNKTIDNKLIYERIELALNARNINLARYLLKLTTPKDNKNLLILNAIYNNPLKINMLKPEPLHNAFYLYGLKRIAYTNPDLSIKLFNSANARKIMDYKHQQEFLAYFALYKALRNKPDASVWFAKVDKKYYTDALVDWEIRSAIQKQNWHKLISIINTSKDKDSYRNQYWYARANAAIGNKEIAHEIYKKLSLKRNYYGFLASQKINSQLSFEAENTATDYKIISIYKPITDLIKNLILTHQDLKASRLINDFTVELPKREKSAFVYWVAKELDLNGKSVYLCNNEELFNQLTLRFPLAHKNIVYANANKYKISSPLIYAIIRQESAFFENITSPVGANGLMQIMPKTAKHIASKSRILYKQPKDLYNPTTNITIGTAYLKYLASIFNSNPILMVAAYNAGPKQVNYWLKNNSAQSMDIWIESMPWSETRNYVQSIIAFYAIYQYRLYNKRNLGEFAKYFGAK